jgi:hypothetical protein
MQERRLGWRRPLEAETNPQGSPVAGRVEGQDLAPARESGSTTVAGAHGGSRAASAASEGSSGRGRHVRAEGAASVCERRERPVHRCRGRPERERGAGS